MRTLANIKPYEFFSHNQSCYRSVLGYATMAAAFDATLDSYIIGHCYERIMYWDQEKADVFATTMGLKTSKDWWQLIDSIDGPSRLEALKRWFGNPFRHTGLVKRFTIYRTDGRQADGEYFVLRLDDKGSDPDHIKACRFALAAYAYYCQNKDLAAEINKLFPNTHFNEITQDYRILECLRQAGIDNTEAYEEGMTRYHEENP